MAHGGFLYQFTDAVSGNGGGAAALGFAPALRPAAMPAFERARPSLHDLDLVVDLGRGIGSVRWWGGLAACIGLCAAAIALRPAVEPLPGASPAALADAEYGEMRALAISPLALGADTGRRMAATDAVQPLTDTPERPRIELTAMLGQGDGLVRALERAGVASAEAKQAAGLVEGILPLSEIEGGTPLDIALGRRPNRNAPRPLDNLDFRARFDLRIEMARVDGTLQARPVSIRVDHTPLRIQGVVGTSLYRAARAAGAPAKAVESYLRALATQMNVSTLGANDRFDLVIEHRRAETGETETGKLLYAGLDRAGGKRLQLMEWEQDGRSQWFEASGVGKTSGALQRPVPGNVSSNFGMRRHPILGFSRMHKGMDFRAGHGTPILAAADGRVTRSGRAGGYGNQVRLAHAGGLATSYSHMSRMTVRAGQSVRQGQVIGYVGSTGLSTGPHLHYELYRNGAPVNPASVKFTTRAQLSGGALSAFRAKLRGLLGTPLTAKPAAGAVAAD